jgi:hypothetical protein
MSEEQKTFITPLHEVFQYHTYNVNNVWDNCSINLSAQTLLDIATYVQINQAKLEQESLEDAELHARLQDTAEMHRINPEWRYRTSDLRL